jgi:hypothetical protein
VELFWGKAKKSSTLSFFLFRGTFRGKNSEKLNFELFLFSGTLGAQVGVRLGQLRRLF